MIFFEKLATQNGPFTCFHTMALAHSVIFRGEKADDHQQVYCGSQWAMAEGEKSIEHRVYSESVNSLWYSIRVIHFFSSMRT